MSFDLGVWYPKERLSDQAAAEVYRRLCDSQTFDLIGHSIIEHPSIEAFYLELTALHPEIDDIPEERVDDHDYCPWSCALDRSEAHVIMACVWPKADYVGELVHRLARKHGLAVYDPQSDRITYPDDPQPTGAAKQPWWKFW